MNDENTLTKTGKSQSRIPISENNEDLLYFYFPLRLIEGLEFLEKKKKKRSTNVHGINTMDIERENNLR